MRKPWYLLYGRHIGRSRGGPGNHFFHEGAAKGPPEASGGGFGPILLDLGVFAHFRSKIVFFSRSDFKSILGLFLGGAGGRGGVPGSLQNLQKGARGLTRPAPLRGGGES